LIALSILELLNEFSLNRYTIEKKLIISLLDDVNVLLIATYVLVL